MNNKQYTCDTTMTLYRQIEEILYEVPSNYGTSINRVGLNGFVLYKGTLYIGSSEGASIALEGSRGIDVVISLGTEYYLPRTEIEHYRYKIDDSLVENGNDIRTFDDVAEKINIALIAGKNVLVNCHMGISRSATAIIYYLFKYSSCQMIDIVRHVKQSRRIIQPNARFIRILVDMGIARV